MKIYSNWIVGHFALLKNPTAHKQRVYLFIQSTPQFIVYVDKSFESLIKSNINYFDFDITQIRFIKDIWKSEAVQCDSGNTYCLQQRRPKGSADSVPNIIEMLGENALHGFEYIDKIQEICCRFRSLFVRGNYLHMLMSAKQVQKMVRNYRLMTGTIFLDLYYIIALQNEACASLEMGDPYRSIKAFRKSENRIKKFIGSSHRMPGSGNYEHRFVEQQLFLDTLIKKGLKHHQFHYTSSQNVIVYQHSRNGFHIDSYKLLKLAKGKELNDVIDELTEKRCDWCHVITSKKKNKKCKCEDCCYCSKSCQKKHWKKVHRFECSSKKNNDNES